MLSLLHASNLIVRYVVKRFENANAPIVLLKALKALCEADPTLENEQVYASIKYMKYPEGPKSSNGSGSDKDSPKSEVKRSRSELSIVIMNQLTQPLGSNAVPLTNFSEAQFDFSELFKKEVMELLKSLNASDIFLKWCINCIPIISPTYTLKYSTDLVLQQKSLHLPQSQTDAQSIKQCLKQIDIDTNNILCVLQLPIMDPLSKEKILQLSQLSMSVLYCCIVTSIAHSISLISSTSTGTQTSTPKNVSTSTTTQQTQQSASASVKESTVEADPHEEISRSVVNQSLEVFKSVAEIFKKFAQSHVHQNHLCMGAWMLLAGIQGAMSATSGSQKSSQLQQSTPDDFVKSKSPSRDHSGPQQPRVNLFKVQQSFGILNVSIAKYCINLLEDLLSYLKIDAGDGKLSEDVLISQQQQLPSELINFDVLKMYSTMDRIICALNGTTIQQLMTFLATISYRKACSLKHLTDFGGEQLSFSDSTTYYNDTLSCSDESDTEEEEDGNNTRLIN